MKPALVFLLGLCAVPGAAAAGAVDRDVDRVVRIVNGVPVFDSEVVERAGQVDRAAAELDAAGRIAAHAERRSRALDSLIDEALMVAAARDLGLAISTGEVDQAVATVEQQNHLDDDGLATALKREGMSLAIYRDGLERQLLLMKTQQALVLGAVLVSEADERAAFDQAKASGATGSFEDQRAAIHAELYQRALVGAMRRWLSEQRRAAYIETRAR